MESGLQTHQPIPLPLVIENLEFRYPSADGQDGWSIRVPRFELQRGEQVLLTGGSGRGKSTLLYLIAGLMDPQMGSVMIGGENIHARRAAARDRLRGRSIGMIFQTFNLLLGFTAAENVMAALMFSELPGREHRVRAVELLHRLGITKSESMVDRMSVGQQQRVAVARAVACRPAIVLADEPTASLDPENATVAMDLIQSICREEGAALLCTSHDPRIVERFARRVSLEDLMMETVRAD